MDGGSAETALDTDYLDRNDKQPSLVSENRLQQGNMAECAANAWAVLHDLKGPEEPRALVAEMWHIAATPARPPRSRRALATHSLAANDLGVAVQEPDIKSYERHRDEISQLQCPQPPAK